MDFNLKDKVVGISGAASQNGIGFAIAKKFLEEKAKVFICDINEDALNKAVLELSTLGQAKGYIADISNEESVKNLFECAKKDFQGIDIFVNNAGIYPQAMLMDMSASQWDLTMGINLKSVFLCAKEAFFAMKEKGGVIINAASFASIMASAGSGAYAASKAAVYSLTKTLASELAPYNIRVCGFIPGVIETNMTQQVLEQKGDEILGQIALHRLGKPEDVANAVTFLAGDGASYMTGTFIEVSGGKYCVQNPNMPHQKLKEM